MQRPREKRATNPFVVLFLQLCGAYLEVIATIVFPNWLKKSRKKEGLSEFKQTLAESRTAMEQKKNQRPQCFDKCMMSVHTLLRSFTIR